MMFQDLWVCGFKVIIWCCNLANLHRARTSKTHGTQWRLLRKSFSESSVHENVPHVNECERCRTCIVQDVPHQGAQGCSLMQNQGKYPITVTRFILLEIGGQSVPHVQPCLDRNNRLLADEVKNEVFHFEEEALIV